MEPKLAAPVTDRVDLRVVAPVTPNPAATSKVEPIIVAPEILPVPSTVNVDLNIVAPVTPKPAYNPTLPTESMDTNTLPPEFCH